MAQFATDAHLTLDAALDFFYRSTTYTLVSQGVADMHCMSDTWLAHELQVEYDAKTA